MSQSKRYQIFAWSLVALAVFWFFFVGSVFTSNDAPWIIAEIGRYMFWGVPLIPVFLIAAIIFFIKSKKADSN